MTTASADRAHQYQRWQGTLGKAHWTWPAIVVNASRDKARQDADDASDKRVPGLTASACFIISLLESVVRNEQAKGFTIFWCVPQIDISGVTRLAEFRDVLWRILDVTKIQMFWVLFVVARVGSWAANDLKSRACRSIFPSRSRRDVSSRQVDHRRILRCRGRLFRLIALGLGHYLRAAGT